MLNPLPRERDHHDPHFPDKETEIQEVRPFKVMGGNATTATFPQAPPDSPCSGWPGFYRTHRKGTSALPKRKDNGNRSCHFQDLLRDKATQRAAHVPTLSAART